VIHALAIIGAVIWFGLNGLLWYAKPSNSMWLAGSAVLGMIFFAGFFWYLALADRQRSAVDARGTTCGPPKPGP
jgi:hypothetical protein